MGTLFRLYYFYVICRPGSTAWGEGAANRALAPKSVISPQGFQELWRLRCKRLSLKLLVSAMYFKFY